MIPQIRTYFVTEMRALRRSKILPVYLFIVPAFFTLVLGPAISGGREIDHGRSTIGFAIMFAYFGVNYAGRSLYREYGSACWVRTAIARPNRAAFLVGKCLPTLLVLILQLAAFSALAATVLEFDFGDGAAGVLQLAMVLALHALSAVATGVLAYVLISSLELFVSITYLTLVLFATTGGTIVVPGELPAWSRAVGAVTPHRWSMDAVDAINGSGGAWDTVLRSCALLAVYSVVLIAISLARLDFSRPRTTQY